MKSILCSLAVVITIAIAGAAILTLIGVAHEVATALASGSLALVPTVREGFEKRAQDPATRATLATFEGYGRSTPLQILYATAVLIGIMNVSSAAAGSIIGFSGGGLSSLAASAGMFVLLVVLPACFLVGRWMGRTARRDAWWAPFLVALSARAATGLFDYLVLDTKEYSVVYDADKAIGHSVLMGLWGVVVLALFLYWGYWRGRKLRLASYLHYLLQRVSPAARSAIVDLSYEEAMRSQEGISPSATGGRLAHASAGGS